MATCEMIFLRFTYLCLIQHKNLLMCACFDMICAWTKTDSVALLAHVYHISYFPYLTYDICFLKPFHVKFCFSFTSFFFPNKRNIAWQTNANVPFLYLFLLFYKISTQKSSCSYWLCECEAYPNCAWEIQIWIYSSCFTVCTLIACHLKEFWVLHEIVMTGLKKKKERF